MTTLAFTVTGTPAPQGSKQGFVNPTNGRVILTESSKKVRPWRQDVVAAAKDAAEQAAWQVPAVVKAQITFWFRRPKSHYRSGRNAHLLRDNAPCYVGVKPDLDKLLRSSFDALTTSGVIGDDCRVAFVQSVKRYAAAEQATGADIYLTALDQTQGEDA